MTLETRLTRRFGLTHPILSAPMAFVAGGRLAAAVTYAGGLGLVGGGYGDWSASTSLDTLHSWTNCSDRGSHGGGVEQAKKRLLS